MTDLKEYMRDELNALEMTLSELGLITGSARVSFDGVCVNIEIDFEPTEEESA